MWDRRRSGGLVFPLQPLLAFMEKTLSPRAGPDGMIDPSQ